MTKNEIVATAIEDKPELLPSGNVGIVYAPGWTSKGGAWEWTGEEWKARSFITAPTCCTERIVFKWVQGQSIIREWGLTLYDLMAARIEPEQSVAKSSFAIFVEYYKVGEYASALLEVLDGSE